ncbi:MAG: phosphoesterase [Betaproteobacteria bacterium]|nr:phosphoesterase [Betaproteobacteria bacterium]
MAQAHATTTPIEHVIVVVGENHTFDNVFGVYRPHRTQSIMNLLSEGIVKDDGTPGPRFQVAAQRPATQTGSYSIQPTTGAPYASLPQPDTTYATGQPGNSPDPRFPADMPNGPFQITRYVPYSAFMGDPMHRFFQMWQQVDGGRNDLFAWTAMTAGIGNHNDGFGTGPDDTHQGGVAMGFYNMETGDAPLFKAMADNYAISDNYHQGVMGGTGANFLMLVTADAAFYNVGGTATVPLTAINMYGVTASQVENPNPQAAGSNTNWYTEDGYRGGSYVNCADESQPGVGEIAKYVRANGARTNCAPGHYYLLNNYNLGYKADGTPVDLTASPFTLPPQPASLPTIADELSDNGVSWKYYSGGRGNGTNTSGDYCGICDPLTGFTSIMTDPSKRANLQDVNSLYADIASGNLPSVSFVRPPEIMAGHPANATLPLYENFSADLVNMVHSHPDLWKSTAIIITTDEGGGYYDSGYVQPVDFFGDGTRIPLIVVSPYARKGHVDHVYNDHASVLKFIEHNWGLGPLSSRSRDNLPNPVQWGTSYKPQNAPAVGDLMTLFDFSNYRDNAPAITVSQSDGRDRDEGERREHAWRRHR